MKRMFIFAGAGFYNPETKRISIGGVETYIYDLAKLSVEMGYSPVVCELNREQKDNHYQFDGIEIWQIPHKGKSFIQKGFDRIYKEYNNDENLFVISTDQMTIKAPYQNVIAINHGIAFDEPIPGIKGRVIKLLKCLKNIWRGQLVPNVVCVDYNYYNWFRTLATISDESKFIVIPNYSQGQINADFLNNKLQKSKRRKIVFARRFVWYRGTKIFAEAISRILKEFTDIEVTFAGTGPLEGYLKDKFKNCRQVNFTSYKSCDSVSFHSDFDIAVVPTIFSEGTSLSLCEAMSAGCFCIATRVGGMTNIVVDNFNGRLIEPTVNGIYSTIKDTLNLDDDQFNRIVRNGYQTACQGFSKLQWQNKWTNYISLISK